MQCPKCGKKSEPYWVRGLVRYYKCSHCGAYWIRRPKKASKKAGGD